MVQPVTSYRGLDIYGYSREPESALQLPYGRFRNIYLYITDECQLRCAHCYMGVRLDAARVMPFELVCRNLQLWRRMGGSKLSILGGEPTLHPRFLDVLNAARAIGFEKLILNTNALASARRRLSRVGPRDLSYIQVSLDGGSPRTHDSLRGKGTFKQTWATTVELCERGFDTRIICTVNKRNIVDCLDLLSMADEIGVSLVKFHVFSGIGNGATNADMLISPRDWIAFYKDLETRRHHHRVQIWYQPTYAYRREIGRYAAEGYRGCIGRTLDRISVFPDGRAYVCSYLFDTNLNYAFVDENQIRLNKGDNEFDLFTGALEREGCGTCKEAGICGGGCPAEAIALGGASCAADAEIVPVCRLWKSDI